MKTILRHRLRAMAVVIAWMLAPLAAGATGLTEGDATLQTCDNVASLVLERCFTSVSTRLRDCYLKTGQACPADDRKITTALNTVAFRINRSCSTVSAVQGLKYGFLFLPSSLTSRLQTECLGAAQTLAARTFGGPQASVLATATSLDTLVCAKTAYTEAAKLMTSSFKAQSKCVRNVHRGKTCDLPTVAADITAKQTTAVSKIRNGYRRDPGCSNTSLKTLIALDESAFIDRALEQARCMVATAHADVGTLPLDCGPRPAVPVPPRGQWTQVILDNATWGTKCGDGSNYAFWIRLAPAGSPAERVIVDLQSGGACVLESDCRNLKDQQPELLEALSDYQPNGPQTGHLSSNPADNPFANWTMMALPYCTLDVHFGGGVTTPFSDFSVNRYGALNVRAALRYLRDVLWPELAATETEGYRPDRLRVIFSGESAGGFGVSYNYHYLLDDLRWIHTTAVPDSALGLDSQGVLGVRMLGYFFLLDPPTGWGAKAFQPAYCQTVDCAVLPTLQATTAVRLKAVPDQQILNISNQVDDVQQVTTFFTNLVDWTNAARAAYCANLGLNGVHSFLPADPTPTHAILANTDRFTGQVPGLISDGVSPRDFLSAAISDPDGVVDRVQEGTLVTALPGVNPFSCTVAP